MAIASRRRLLKIGGISAASLIAAQANADTAFTSFAFTATGEPTGRTMPDRLAEIKNVMDFGAKGDGSTDDTTAIQNAINWTSGANRGTIYFPIGHYVISSPLTFNLNGALSICFRGEGYGSFLDGGTITGGAGYTLDRHLVSPSNQAQVVIEKLRLTGNDGSIRVGSCNSVAIRECSLGGSVGITTEDTAGTSSQNILIESVKFPNANGLIMGGPGTVLGCDFTGCSGAGARMYGNGWAILGCRAEENNIAYLIGVDSGATDRGASGFVINGGTTEANYVSFDFSGTCNGFNISSVAMLGHDETQGSPAVGLQTISSYTYNSGTGAVVLTMASAIPSGGRSATTISTAGLNIAALNGNFTGASVAGNGLTVSYTGSTGQAGSPSGGGTLGIGTQRGIYVRAGKASNGVFSGLTNGNFMDVSAFEIDNASSRANNLVVSCTMAVSGGAGSAWTTPTNAYTAQYVNSNVDPVWTYSQLPTGGNVLEGDEFSISDATTASCSDSACNWGANVTGGTGSLHRLVRWNGSNWTVVAK